MVDIFEKIISYKKQTPKQTESNLEKLKNMHIDKISKKLPLIPLKIIRENIAVLKQEHSGEKGHIYPLQHELTLKRLC